MYGRSNAIIHDSIVKWLILKMGSLHQLNCESIGKTSMVPVDHFKGNRFNRFVMCQLGYMKVLIVIIFYECIKRTLFSDQSPEACYTKNVKNYSLLNKIVAI